MRRGKKLAQLSLLVLVLLGWVVTGWARKPHPEIYYSRCWCNQHQGLAEYELPDGSRIDCLTRFYAVEVDWAAKWPEAIGQSLYYASFFEDRAPAVVLLVRGERDLRFVRRLMKTIRDYNLPIQVFLMPVKNELVK